MELGVEMARLLFGSEILMRGAEPTPQRVEGLSLGYDVIVPVPASSKKRGYNVPERMAGRWQRRWTSRWPSTPSAVPALAAIRPALAGRAPGQRGRRVPGAGTGQRGREAGAAGG